MHGEGQNHWKRELASLVFRLQQAADKRMEVPKRDQELGNVAKNRSVCRDRPRKTKSIQIRRRNCSGNREMAAADA